MFIRKSIIGFTPFKRFSTQRYETIIGLEVHAQLQTNSKLFSGASTQFFARPNTQVAPFDLSLPGTLPVLNRKCVELALKTALSLNCKIPAESRFDRKHYFYGDMPNNYQITQQFHPIALNGYLDFIVYDDYYYSQKNKKFEPYLKRCRLKQIQLEQDSGKSLVDVNANENLIDLNRAGVPLIEFVFEPDLRTAIEATSLVRELIAVLRTLDTCSCHMEEGAIRVDANISLRPLGSTELGVRTEVKNLNSLRFIREAIEFETQRQKSILDTGGTVINETMAFDFRTKQTTVMRDKEIVQDYRFMPEPNLPALHVIDSVNDSPSQINVEPIRNSLPQLPAETRNVLLRKYQLNLRNIFMLINDTYLLDIFKKLYKHSKLKNGNEIVSYLIDTLVTEEKRFWERNVLDIRLDKLIETIEIEYLAELIDLKCNQKISSSTTIDLIKFYLQQENKSEPPSVIIDRFNWWLINDQQRIEEVCRQVAMEYSKISKKFSRNGKRKKDSILIQKACALLNNQVNEEELWSVYDRILRGQES